MATIHNVLINANDTDKEQFREALKDDLFEKLRAAGRPYEDVFNGLLSLTPTSSFVALSQNHAAMIALSVYPHKEEKRGEIIEAEYAHQLKLFKRIRPSITRRILDSGDVRISATFVIPATVGGVALTIQLWVDGVINNDSIIEVRELRTTAEPSLRTSMQSEVYGIDAITQFGAAVGFHHKRIFGRATIALDSVREESRYDA